MRVDDVEIGLVDRDPPDVRAAEPEHLRRLVPEVARDGEAEERRGCETGDRERGRPAARDEGEDRDDGDRREPYAAGGRKGDREHEQGGGTEGSDGATDRQRRGPRQREQHRVGERQVVPKETHDRIARAACFAGVHEEGPAERRKKPCQPNWSCN